MNGPFVGQRIILRYLPASNLFRGEIVEVLRRDVRSEAHLCRVKLDSQDEPVGGVLYYDEPPEVVKSSLWQICWPAPKRIQRRIVCQKCGASGPLALTEQEAWRLWGIRPFADALTQALEAAPKSGGEMITDFFGQRG